MNPAPAVVLFSLEHWNAMPTRYLKPGIRDSELIDGLSPMAEVMFYRLLVTVDDFGRFDARPAMIKSQCFPIKEKFTQKHCEEALRELCEAGLLMVYFVDLKPFLQILKWDNVPRSKESKFPAYLDGCMQMYADVCNPRTLLPVTVTVTKTETVNRATEVASPEGVSTRVWQDFKKHRKAKRAEITQSAIDGIKREADKAGWSMEDALSECCARGWVGFKADWVAGASPAKQSSGILPGAI
ncbi:MAG: hypothetical protein EAZ92_17950 [Candidatus Kapaibacterium sp.]|nr:MAG: hypothetical protein EAZ92_17950 [Candidatus Kapabacteria bacterium]